MSVNYIKCSKCGREFHSCAIRTCPHEAVNKRYGKDICYNCCMRCKHSYIASVGQGCELRDKMAGRKTIKYKRYWENGIFMEERKE